MELLYKELLPYDHIIFDWNGTLLSDVEFVWTILCENLERHKLPVLSLDTFRESFRFPIKEFYEELGVTQDIEQDFHRYYITNYNQRYKDTQLYHGTFELIHELKNLKKKISILSAAEQSHLHEATDHYGVFSHMHHVFGVANHGAEGKTARGHDLVREVPIAKESTIIVGDTIYDADVGKALDINVLLVADGHQSYQQLLKSNCKILPSRYASSSTSFSPLRL